MLFSLIPLTVDVAPSHISSLVVPSIPVVLKYVHVELALCFLVTNYVYPIKIDRLTYHSIAKVAPVLPEKSP